MGGKWGQNMYHESQNFDVQQAHPPTKICKTPPAIYLLSCVDSEIVIDQQCLVRQVGPQMLMIVLYFKCENVNKILKSLCLIVIKFNMKINLYIGYFSFEI